MAKTKTAPKVDGGNTESVSTNDAPAAVPKTTQAEPKVAKSGVTEKADAVKLVRLGGSQHESALRQFTDTGKVASGRVLRWNNGVPEFYRKG